MVHSISESVNQHRRRKRCKKSAGFSPASNMDLTVNNNNNNNNNDDDSSMKASKVQVRELVTYDQHQPSRVGGLLLPEGFEESLYHLLAKEMIYHPRTDYLFNNAVCEDKVDAGMRDEAVFNLRFLHKFHNLKSDCFAHAVNLTDRFLARVKVKPKYMACLTTASYLIAAKMIEEPENWPTPEKLVRMARCGGSPSDLERMEAIIRVKLRPVDDAPDLGGCLEAAVTPLHFLAALRPLFDNNSEPGAYERAVGDLETCLCSVAMYAFRPAQLALCVAMRYLAGGGDGARAMDRVAKLLELSASDLAHCGSAVEAEADRKIRGDRRRRFNRRRGPTQPPMTPGGGRIVTTTWPGLRRLRSRRSLPPLSQMQMQLMAAASCSGLDTISEEVWLDEDCLPDICQLFH